MIRAGAFLLPLDLLCGFMGCAPTMPSMSHFKVADGILLAWWCYYTAASDVALWGFYGQYTKE